MFVETGIFGGNQRIYQGGGNLLEFAVGTVLEIVLAQHDTIAGVYFGGLIGFRILQFRQRWHETKPS